MPFCVALKRAMMLKRLSVPDVAKRVNIRSSDVYKWLSGETVPAWNRHTLVHRETGVYVQAKIDLLLTREERIAAGRGEVPNPHAVGEKRRGIPQWLAEKKAAAVAKRRAEREAAAAAAIDEEPEFRLTMERPYID